MAHWRRPIWQRPQVKVHHKLVLAVPHKITFHKSRRRMFHFSIIFYHFLSFSVIFYHFLSFSILGVAWLCVFLLAALAIALLHCPEAVSQEVFERSWLPKLSIFAMTCHTPLTFLWGLLSQLCYCSTHGLNMVEPWSTILPLSIMQAANKIKLIKQLTFWSHGRQISIPVSPLGRMEPLRHPAWAQHGCWLVSLGSSMWLCQMGPYRVQVIIKSLHQVDSLRDLRAFNDYSL